MKKILITLFLSLTITVFAQDKKVLTVLADSGDAYSAAFQIPAGYSVKNILFPTLTASTTSFKLKAGTGPTDLDSLWYDGAVFNETITRSGCAYSFSANVTAGWEWVIILFPVTQTANATIKEVCIKL